MPALKEMFAEVVDTDGVLGDVLLGDDKDQAHGPPASQPSQEMASRIAVALGKSLSVFDPPQG